MSNTDKILPALAQAQKNYPTIGKDKTARVETKAGGSYTYDYLDLAGIMHAVRAPNADEGLFVIHLCVTEDGQLYSESRVIHAASQQHIASRLPIDSRLTAQALGAQITYSQKYCTKGLLGIQADEDTDAAGVDDEQRGRASQAAGEQVALNQFNAFKRSAHKVFKASGEKLKPAEMKAVLDTIAADEFNAVGADDLHADQYPAVLRDLAERFPAAS